MKKPEEVYSLRKKAKQYFQRSLGIFFLILLITLLVTVITARNIAKGYLESSIKQVAENVDAYLNQIERAAFTISSNNSFLSYYSLTDPHQEIQTVSSMFEAANNLSTYVPDFVDISVVSRQGTANSYYSGYSYSVLEELRSHQIFDTDNSSRGFIFLSDTPESSEYFIYYFPIQDFVANPSLESQKTATAFFLLGKNTLRDYLNAGPSDYAYYQLEFDGNVVCTQTDKPAPAQGLSATAQLSSNAFQLSGMLRASIFNASSFVLYSIILLLFLVFISLYILKFDRFITQFVSVPITNLLKQLNSLDSIACSDTLQQTSVEEFNQIVYTTNNMLKALQESSRQIITSQNHLYEVELREKENELYALQSQLNPHFLYNTLECIRGLATIGQTDDIKTIVQHLSAFYRYSSSPAPFVTIMDEVELVCKYLQIYQLRTGGTPTYNVDIDDELLDCDTVRMILQPIVENCIKHGFINSSVPPHIQLLGSRDKNGQILLRVVDNGSGMSYQQLTTLREQLEYSFNESLMRGNKHLGLYNINRRIKLLLGSEYGLSVFSNPNGTEVDILLPYIHN